LVISAGMLLAGIYFQRQRMADRAVAHRQEQEARAVALVKGLATAETTAVDRLVADMAPLTEWTEPQLKTLAPSVRVESKDGLPARRALWRTHPALSDELIAYLPHCRPDELAAVRDALRPHAKVAADRLWPILLDERSEPGQRLRAASALATFAPDSRGWPNVAAAVVEPLVDEGPLRAGAWPKALWPVRLQLLAPLAAASVNRRYEVERDLAATLMADYAADQPETLGELLLTAEAHAYTLYLAKAKNYPDLVSARMQ